MILLIHTHNNIEVSRWQYRSTPKAITALENLGMQYSQARRALELLKSARETYITLHLPDNHSVELLKYT